jgi:hypothetical protein
VATVTARLVPITDVCEVERAKEGKTYPAGTCYVTLSAAHDTVLCLSEDGMIESRYAALIPRDGAEADYIKVVLDRAFPRWLESHRTGINLKFEELATLYVEWHDNRKQRREVVEASRRMDELMEAERKTVEGLKGLKSYMLLRMFI